METVNKELCTVCQDKDPGIVEYWPRSCTIAFGPASGCVRFVGLEEAPCIINSVVAVRIALSATDVPTRNHPITIGVSHCQVKPKAAALWSGYVHPQKLMVKTSSIPTFGILSSLTHKSTSLCISSNFACVSSGWISKFSYGSYWARHITPFIAINILSSLSWHHSSSCVLTGIKSSAEAHCFRNHLVPRKVIISE